MQICCTQKMLKLLKATPVGADDADFFCWSVNVETIFRKNFIWFTNDATRMSFAIYGLKAKELANFDQYFEAGVRTLFESCGITPEQIAKYFTAAGESVITKTRGRTYTARLSAVMLDFSAMDIPVYTEVDYQHEFAEKTNQLLTKVGPDYVYPIEQLHRFFEELMADESVRAEANNETPTAKAETSSETLAKKPSSKHQPREAFDLVVQLKLAYKQPFRRVVVPTDATFNDLHEIIQIAYGWENRHLYKFQLNKGRELYQIVMPEMVAMSENQQADQVLSDKSVKLADLLEPGETFTYVYDIADEWRHTIHVRGLEQAAYPKCLMASGGRPPEDIGGPQGYDFLIEMLASLELLPVEDQQHLLALAKELENYEPNMQVINSQLKAL